MSFIKKSWVIYEKVLSEQMKGYKEYRKKNRLRISKISIFHSF